MEEALVARMLAVAGVAGLAGERVGWFERPRPDTAAGETWEDAVPALVLTTVYGERGWTHEGPSGFDTGNVQFEAFALDPDAAMALMRAAQGEMETVPYRDAGGVRFHPGMLADRFEEAETPEGFTTPLFRVLRSFRFHYQPAPA